MGSIQSAVRKKAYEEALLAVAVRLSGLLDDLDDEKNAAPISRELRLVLTALGIDAMTVNDLVDGFRTRADSKL